ncbi:MAG: DUF924 family protein [Candidatus Binatia bacterium]
MGPTLEFWFEFASTYSYPAAMRIGALAAAAGVPLRWRAFLLGPVFAAQGLSDTPMNLFPAKGQYMWRDVERICAAAGLRWRRPSAFPRGSLLAARIAACAVDEPWLPAFVRAVYSANFGDDRDVGDAGVVAELLAAIGQPAEPWIDRAQSAEGKQRLRAQTDEALARGLFGAPVAIVGDELFWGNDRIEAALAWARPDRGVAAASEAVLDFWFGDRGDDAAERTQRWFTPDPAFDAEIRDRFGALICAAAQRELDGWAASPRGRLALILLLDQFPRNVYRGQREAFASDAHALSLALAGIDFGVDRALGTRERAFFYLPLGHAEDPAMQDRAVTAVRQLVAESPAALRGEVEEFLRFARAHRDIIARFGRFPHRNAALGRASTADEKAYLDGGPDTFGQ